MSLRIERPRGALPDEAPIVRALIRCSRLLADADDNGVAFGLAPGRHSFAAVIGARDALAAAAWDAPIVGETALSAVHDEHSGWGLPAGEAAATPRVVAVLDVLDWLATAMGPADTLVVEAAAA